MTTSESPFANYGYAVLTAQALRAPGDVAVSYLGQQVTYRELDERVNRRANALASAGVTPGTRVASLIGETLSIAELYLAQAKLGSVLAALNPYWSDDVLVGVVESVGAPVFLYDAASAAMVDRVRERLPGVKTWVRAGGPAEARSTWTNSPQSAPPSSTRAWSVRRRRTCTLLHLGNDRAPEGGRAHARERHCDRADLARHPATPGLGLRDGSDHLGSRLRCHRGPRPVRRGATCARERLRASATSSNVVPAGTSDAHQRHP